METIHIYHNELGDHVDSYTGKDNNDCERWAERNYGGDSYHWSYTLVEVSNAVEDF